MSTFARIYIRMKKIILLLVVLVLGKGAAGQNLVPNPSFEIDTACPHNLAELYYAVPWFQPWVFNGSTSLACSSDYYNQCNNGIIGVPNNIAGGCFAHTGVAYCGICLFESMDSNYREYIEVQLMDTLITNKKYCVDFYVSLADSSGYATNKFGAYFSSLPDTTSSLLSGNNLFSNSPQVLNPSNDSLKNKTGWMEVSGSFIANGGEKYLTIGNFFDDANSHAYYVGNCGWNSGGMCTTAYYYIDDISVIYCDPSDINELTIDNEITLYPNPASNELEISSNELGIKEVRIYNVLGYEMLKQVQHDKSATIDVSTLNKGIYFIEVQSEKGILRKKFVKE